MSPCTIFRLWAVFDDGADLQKILQARDQGMTLLRGVYFFLVIRAADRIDEAFQGGAVDELHRDSPMSVPVFSQVVNRDNGRMVQFRIQAAFFDKGTDRIGIILKAFVQALDCNHTVEHEIPRFGDPADASRAEIADILKTFGKVRDCIGSESLPEKVFSSRCPNAPARTIVASISLVVSPCPEPVFLSFIF